MYVQVLIFVVGLCKYTFGYTYVTIRTYVNCSSYVCTVINDPKLYET